MNPIGSNAVASQAYSGVQRKDAQGDAQRAQQRREQQEAARVEEDERESFRLPSGATPRGDWVLANNANPQNFESNAPRGSYLNVVV